MPFFGTPQRPNVRPLRNSHPQHPQHKKNKTKKYLGTHTRRPCGGYWVAPRLLRIGRNERNTTGTQQNTGNRYLTVIYSSFYRHLCHPIPHVFKTRSDTSTGVIFTKLNYFSFVSGYENKNRTYYNALSLPCIIVRRGCPVPPPQCPFLLSCFSSTCILFRLCRFPCVYM